MNRMLFAVPAILIGLGISPGVPAQTPSGGMGEASPEQKQLPSTRTRAEVRAECEAALKANRTPSGECSPEPAAAPSKPRTREEVRAECVEALKANRTPSGECSPEPGKK